MQKLKFLKPALVLLIITVGVALLLAVVNFITHDKIILNEQIKRESAIKELFPSLESFEEITTDDAPGCVTGIGKVVGSQNSHLGYFVEVTPVGFKDVISLIVALDKNGCVLDVVCMSTSETPGVGTKATQDSYFSSFTQKNSENVSDVDTITGATISSKAVKHGIEDACRAVSALTEVK